MNRIQDIKQSADFVTRLIAAHDAMPDNLIAILQDIQTEYRYLPEYALKQVAKELNLPIIQVYGVATFFKAFSLTPRGRHIVTVCLGTACHVRGGKSILEEMERQLGVKNGGTTKDMEFTLEAVNCLGACALGPVVVVDEVYYGNMNSSKIKKLLGDYRSETPRSR